jgi:ADP-ribose pyrophosphatase
VRLPDGQIIDEWPLVNLRDYVNVLAVNSNGKALITEGYKHGVGRSSWQVVGGYLEPDENPLVAAQRELREETGCESDGWESIGRFVVDLNRHAGIGYVFLAHNVRQIGMPSSDDLERQNIQWVSLSELANATRDGSVMGMSHAATIGLALITLGGR